MMVLDTVINVFIQMVNGDVIVNEITYKDRCCFRQKCVYKRVYHYQN